MGWFLLLLLLCLAGVVGFSFYAYRIAFYSPKKGREHYEAARTGQYAPLYDTMTALITQLEQLPARQVCISSFDGLKLYGRYYHVQDGAPLQIQCHGYRGHALRDFCGGSKLARELGHNMLLIDQRAHGKSEGHTITFGVKEARDCLSWAEFAVREWGDSLEIFLTGVSMGAATVLSAARLPLPDNVKGIIADCPYSSPKKIICKVAEERHFPPALTYPFVCLGGFLFGGLLLRKKDSPVEAVKHTQIPILLLHGEDDRFVPWDMSREIFDACASPKTLVTFPGAAHGVSYLADPQKYKKAVAGFVNQCRQSRT